MDLLNESSIELYLAALQEFDTSFCDAMVAGYDFTIRLEVRGDDGKVLHIRNHNDGFRRPPTKSNSRKIPTHKG